MSLLRSHLRAYWRENLIVFAGLLALAGLLAGLPVYLSTMAGRSLEARIIAAPVASRNLLVGGAGLSDELYAQIRDRLGILVRERVDVRDVQMPALSAIYGPVGERSFDEFLAIHAFSFSNLDQTVDVVEGRLPAADSGKEDLIEAVVGPDVLGGPSFTRAAGSQVEHDNVAIGDELQADNGRFRFRIVGVVRPKEPESDVWWGSLLPFSFLRQPLNGASQPETVTLSLLVDPAALAGSFPAHIYQWRLLIDPAAASGSVEAVEAALRDVETGLASASVQVDTGLLDLIGGYQGQLDAARGTFFLLAVQSALFALIVMGLTGSALAGARAVDNRLLAGRGTSAGGLARLFALETLPAALLAALLGPLAVLLLSAAGEKTAVSGQTWLISLAATLAGWLVLCAAYALALRASLRALPGPYDRPAARPAWQRYFIDVLLLALGGAIVWQTLQGGLAALRLPLSGFAPLGRVDPLLLLGPTLFFLGTALFLLRLYPPLLRLIARWLGRGAGLPAAYGAAHLGRGPRAANRLIFPITLATGLLVFAAVWQSTVSGQQREMAHYRVGADARVALPLTAGPAEVEQLAGLDGVRTATPVYVNERARWAPELSRSLTLIAVDPATFGEVGRYAPGTSTLTIGDILPPLSNPSGKGIPAVLSYDAYPPERQVGDVVSYVVGNRPVDFEVRGLIRAFPATGTPFLITNLPLLRQEVDFAALAEPFGGRLETWLETGRDGTAAVISAIEAGQGPAGASVLRTAADVQADMGADLVGQQTLGAFRLVALAVSLLSLAVFGLLAAFTARERSRERALLWMIGLDSRAARRIAGLEAAAAIGLGLAAGTALGAGLAYLMRPLLGSAIAGAVGTAPAGTALLPLQVAWPSLLLGLLLLAAGYALAWLAGWLLRGKNELTTDWHG